MEAAIDWQSANPAEVMFAYGASHVRTTFILFNECPTLGTVGSQTIRLVTTPLLNSLVGWAAAPFAVILLSTDLACISLAERAFDSAAPASFT